MALLLMGQGVGMSPSLSHKPVLWMTRRSCRRFPEQRLTREEALKGVSHYLSALHAGHWQLRHAVFGARNDSGPCMGIVQRKYVGIHHLREARGLRCAIEGHHDHSGK